MTVNHCQYFAGDKTFCFKNVLFCAIVETLLSAKLIKGEG